MKSTFANNIKSLRIDNDYSQNDLSKALGITRSRFFNCSIDDLLKSRINTVVKSKIDTIISEEPRISVNLNEFNYSDLKEKLLKNKRFYEEKKKTILSEIDVKISEIDSLLNFINNIYNEDLTNEISHNKKDE